MVMGAIIGDFAGTTPPVVGKKVNQPQIDDPTNFSAFKITLITNKGDYL
jgi:hypothetical protein